MRRRCRLEITAHLGDSVLVVGASLQDWREYFDLRTADCATASLRWRLLAENMCATRPGLVVVAALKSRHLGDSGLEVDARCRTGGLRVTLTSEPLILQRLSALAPPS